MDLNVKHETMKHFFFLVGENLQDLRLAEEL